MLSFCVLWCPTDGRSWIQRTNALEHCFRIPWPPLTALPLPIAPTRSNKPSKHWALKKRRRDSDGTQRRHVHHYFRPGHRRRTSFHGCSLRHQCSNADRSQTCRGSGRQCRRRYAPVWFDHPRKQEIATLFADKGIFLLEDCAQAQGATVVGKRAGTFGDAVSFSFYPTKNLGALGDGGAIVTNSAAIAQQIAQWHQYGWSSKYCVEMAGARNSRLGEMQAVIHSEFLPHLDEGNARRNQITERYRKEIKQADIVHPQGDSDGAGRPRNQRRRPSNNWCMHLTSRVLFANFKA